MEENDNAWKVLTDFIMEGDQKAFRAKCSQINRGVVNDPNDHKNTIRKV